MENLDRSLDSIIKERGDGGRGGGGKRGGGGGGGREGRQQRSGGGGGGGGAPKQAGEPSVNYLKRDVGPSRDHGESNGGGGPVRRQRVLGSAARQNVQPYSAPKRASQAVRMDDEDEHDHRGGRLSGGGGGSGFGGGVRKKSLLDRLGPKAGAGSGIVGTKVLVGGLTSDVTEDEVEEFFGGPKSVMSVTLKYDRGGRMLGEGEVVMYKQSEALDMVRNHNGAPITGGGTITIKLAGRGGMDHPLNSMDVDDEPRGLKGRLGGGRRGGGGGGGGGGDENVRAGFFGTALGETGGAQGRRGGGGGRRDSWDDGERRGSSGPVQFSVVLTDDVFNGRNSGGFNNRRSSGGERRGGGGGDRRGGGGGRRGGGGGGGGGRGGGRGGRKEGGGAKTADELDAELEAYNQAREAAD